MFVKETMLIILADYICYFSVAMDDGQLGYLQSEHLVLKAAQLVMLQKLLETD